TPTRKPVVKAAFNAGSLATSAFVGGEVFALLSPERGDILSTCLAVAASALGYFLVNTSLTAGVIALSERQGFLQVWRTNYAWMPLNFLATAAQGAALALASQALGVFGVAVFTLPLVVAWYSFRLYMSKSSEVRQRNAELQSVNEMLRRTNDRLEESHLSVIGALIGALEAKENARAPQAAQIVAVADAYQAMTAERPYRSAMSQKTALKELRANAGTQFNPVVVEAFIAIVDNRQSEFPNAHNETQLVFKQALEAVKVR